MTLRPSISTLFPYTTLFRSWGGIRGGDVGDDVSVSEHYFSFGFLGDFLSSSAARIWSSCDERCPPSSSVSSWAPALATGLGGGGFGAALGLASTFGSAFVSVLGAALPAPGSATSL